jgi:hypothetical protein
VPSDHLATGIINTVSRSGVSLNPRIGEPGKPAPRTVCVCTASWMQTALRVCDALPRRNGSLDMAMLDSYHTEHEGKRSRCQEQASRTD